LYVEINSDGEIFEEADRKNGTGEDKADNNLCVSGSILGNNSKGGLPASICWKQVVFLWHPTAWAKGPVPKGVW
jgi:hypothetical protein